MRLKQLLGVLFLLLMASALAIAANSQLTSVTVTSQGHATTILLHASGAFTHTEYRPVDNLLLVDLTGVAPGKLKDSTQTLNRVGVMSYRVQAYAGANGAEVTRIEFTLSPSTIVAVSQVVGGLQLRVTNDAEPAAPVASVPEKAPDPKPAAAQASGRPVVVRHIGVLRGKSGMEVEILASAPVTPKVMKLAAPDRVVLDLPNAVMAGRLRPIVVNGPEVKAVRMSRFQAEPPVTRVVIDLAAARDYELVQGSGKLVLKLRPAAAAQAQPPAQPAIAAQADKPAEPAAATVQPVAQKAAEPAPAMQTAAAKEFVVVEPKYEAKPAAEPDPKAMAEAAARVMQTSSRTRDLDLLPKPSASMAQPATNAAAEQQQQQRTAPAAQPTTRYTGEPISVNLKDVDLKDFFRLIHEISGLNIVLDPNVKGSLTLVLDDVPWDQALDIVLQNNGLDRRLEGNVLRIATRDTFTREAKAVQEMQEAQALAVNKIQVTHFLSYAHAAEIMPIVKKFLSARGDVVADPRLNALIITDIPSVMPEIQRVMRELDRKTQQVEIEARVVAATRNFARDIGVQLGFGWGNTPTAVTGAGAAGSSPLIRSDITNPSYFTSGGTIPLFSNLGAVGPTSGLSISNATNAYRVDAILSMAESRGLLKILSRPRVVTQNNIVATVKQGVRIPVVTAAQLGGPPTTTYIEAALRLQVTPQITAESTIFLNVDVENTTPDFGRQVAGNPALITQQATTQVLVTDGGTVVIGGVIQTQNSVNIFQVPLLGDIPVLGNLFKRRGVSTSTQELIFFITPKIVQT